MQHFPHELTSRFSPQRVLRTWADTRGGVWLVRQISDGQQLVIKTLPANNHTDSEVLQRMKNIRPATGLSIIEDHGIVGRWHYEVSAYCNMGTLDSVHSTLPFGAWGAIALQQLIEGLDALRQQDIVHCDLKRSNILIHQPAEGSLQFRIADFNAAHQLVYGSVRPKRQHFTLIYAAPEVAAGVPFSQAADFWSLGILMLAWQTGQLPFAELEDDETRALLTTTWQPDFDEIIDQEWRALLAGLLERDPNTRWGMDECSRWLRHDPAIISEGLELSGEHASSTPLHIGSVVVLTASGLAHALIEQWAATYFDVEQQQHEQLLLWLRQELQREDIAARLEQLMQEQHTPELRLLQFCHAIWPSMPATWRGLELTPQNLDAMARAAMHNRSRVEWLQSLLESQSVEQYERWGYEDIAEAGRRIHQFQQEYNAAWDAIVTQGAPEQSRLTNERALPLLVRLACSSEQQETLRRNVASELLNPARILQRASWYLCFGTDSDDMPMAQMVVLQQLEKVSLLNSQQLNAIDQAGDLDENALRNGVIHFRWHEHLMKNLTVSQGSSVDILNPGDTHRPQGMTTLSDELAERWQNAALALRHHTKRFVESMLTKMRSNQVETAEEGDETTQIASLEEPWLQIRMVRVQQTGTFKDVDLLCEAYHTQISWRIPEGWRGRLRIAPAGRFITSLRLNSSLPQQGQMLLLLTDSSNIQLDCKRRWWHLIGQRTAPMRIFFETKEQPIKTLSAHQHLFHSQRLSLLGLSELHRPELKPLRFNPRYIHSFSSWVRRSETKHQVVRRATQKERLIASFFMQSEQLKQQTSKTGEESQNDGTY